VSGQRTTVTLNVQLAAGLPAASLADVHVTVVAPMQKLVPDAGLQVTGTVPSQLSVAIGVVYLTNAQQEVPVSGVLAVMSLGQVTFGDSQSLTVMVNWQLSVKSPPSVAVHVTIVGPSGNVEPLAGRQVTGTSQAGVR